MKEGCIRSTTIVTGEDGTFNCMRGPFSTFYLAALLVSAYREPALLQFGNVLREVFSNTSTLDGRMRDATRKVLPTARRRAIPFCAFKG